jgi:hypothetical protein
MVLSHRFDEGRTIPYRTPLRSPSTSEANGRRSGSTALTTAIETQRTSVLPGHGRVRESVAFLFLPLFTGVRGRGILGSAYPRCCIAPVLRRKAMLALTFPQWGTLGWRPPFPSWLVSKHMPPAKKTPILGIGKDWWERYNFGVEPGLPLSPLRGSPAFLLPHSPGPRR